MSGDPPRFAAPETGGDGSPGGDRRCISPSFERNYPPIRAALAETLAGRAGAVLEIGSGPGQHVAHLARDLPHLVWQPSDPDPGNIESIAAWRERLSPAALRAPLQLDATQDWAGMPALRPLLPLTAVYVQNVLHIAPWAVAEGIVAGAARTLDRAGLLMVYGPFREHGAHTAQSNANFDAALRARDPDWGVRDVDDLAEIASAAGFSPPRLVEMPANNRIAILEHFPLSLAHSRWR